MLNRALAIVLYGVLLWPSVTHGQAGGDVGKDSYTKLMESHFQKMAATGTDVYGPVTNPMWMSVLDTRTGHPPDQPHTPRRVYRLIGAPQGTTFYWDQPLVVAAHQLSACTGEPQYAKLADLYTKVFLTRCVNQQGMFQWGNHAYYDAANDQIKRFSGGHHELRPITPAWELLWQHAPGQTARYIRTMAHRHVYDPHSGGFNRHDDGKRGHAFIESGGILVESLAWLYGETKDPELLETALKIARYSYSHRGPSTGLIRNNPDSQRWDSKVSTTEIGVWAQSLLRAGDYASNDEFSEMARSGISAYLKYGYDSNAKKYYGQVRIDDGKSVKPAKPGYWPREYSDIWNMDQWPTHDYPMPFAEACITLYEKTKQDLFREAIHRWARVVSDATPANGGKGAYAEQYGRCIHFLARAGRVLQDQALVEQARVVADEAVGILYDESMFQGYPGTHLYESVDGVGYLFLALIYLETANELDLYGFGF